LPELVFDSIGGKVGLSQYLKEPFTGEFTRWLAPADPTTARAAITASTESEPSKSFIAPPLFDRLGVPTLPRILEETKSGAGLRRRV
jgi:hypothetical protein